MRQNYHIVNVGTNDSYVRTNNEYRVVSVFLGPTSSLSVIMAHMRNVTGSSPKTHQIFFLYHSNLYGTVSVQSLILSVSSLQRSIARKPIRIRKEKPRQKVIINEIRFIAALLWVRFINCSAEDTEISWSCLNATRKVKIIISWTV